MNEGKKSKLLYIVSQGHSGSTLLDLLCGSIPSVFSMGEMHFFSWQLLQGEVKDKPQSYCSCGKYFDRCDFWGAVIGRLNDKYSIDMYANPKKFNVSINRGIKRNKKNIFHKLLNKLSEISLLYKFSSLVVPLLFWIYKDDVRKTWELYDEVADFSQSDYVVDSSKNYTRFLLLKYLRPESVKLIVLKRDVKGVASSSHHGLSDKVIRKRGVNWHKYYKNIIPNIIKNMDKEEYLYVSYESYCKGYNKVRQEISNFLGYKEELEDVEYISPQNYHLVQGNPIRLIKKEIKIRYDGRWQNRLTEDQIQWLNSLM